MMKGVWCSFFVLSFAFISKAQHVLPLQHDTLVPKMEFIVHGLADYGSSSIERRIANKFLYGGEISDDMINSSFDRHKGINRIGLDLQSELEFRNYQTEKIAGGKYGWLIRGAVQTYGSAVYSKDLFGLIFNGNESYLGQVIDFSGSRGGFWSFQKLGFGLIDKKSKSNISLNGYSIGSFSSMGISAGQLFQSEWGDSLSLRYSGQVDVFRAEKMKRGWGLGIDADIRIPVDISEEKTIYIQFLVRNVGVAYLPNVNRYFADSSVTFQGLTFDQLFGSTAFSDPDFSWMDTLNVRSAVVGQFKLLPAFIQMGKMIDEMNNSKIQAFYGARIYPSVALTPHVYGGIHYSPIKWFATGIHAVYGGYGGFRLGWYSSLNFEKMNIGLATENIYGTLSGMGLGESVVLRMRYKL